MKQRLRAFWRDGEWSVKDSGPQTWIPQHDSRLRKAIRIAEDVIAVGLIFLLISPLAPFGWAAMNEVLPAVVKYFALGWLGLAVSVLLFAMVFAAIVSILLGRAWPSWAGRIDWGEGTGDWRD